MPLDNGLHARPCSLLNKLIANLDCDIDIAGENGVFVDARSIMSLLGLGLMKGSLVTVRGNVRDKSAVDEVADFISRGFDLE